MERGRGAAAATEAAAARVLATVRVGRPGSMVAMARRWRAKLRSLPIPLLSLCDDEPTGTFWCSL
jgi:hypothetical protein